MKRFGLVVLVSALLAVGSQSRLAVASPITADADTVAPLTPVDSDAGNYAAYFKVSAEQALERLELQALAGKLQAQLGELAPRTFGGLWITNAPEFTVTAAFTDPGPEDLAALADARLVPYLRTQRVKSSLQELLQAMSRYASSPDAIFDMGIDVTTNRAVIYTTDATTVKARFGDMLASDADVVDVRGVRSLSAPAVDVYGGLSISLCTAGFGIIRAGTAERGIVTAGHCPDSQTANGVSLPFRDQVTTGAYDLQWNAHGTSTIKNWIKWEAGGTTRAITSRKNKVDQVTGQTVCKYGKTTDYGCGEIVDRFYRPTGCISSATATYVYVHRNNTHLLDGGDSGGPWFLNNTAYGLSNCSLTLQEGPPKLTDGIYTAEDYIEIGLNITVMTAP